MELLNLIHVEPRFAEFRAPWIDSIRSAPHLESDATTVFRLIAFYKAGNESVQNDQKRKWATADRNSPTILESDPFTLVVNRETIGDVQHVEEE
jgi:hypothetical protein